MANKHIGWRDEPARHALAAKGVHTRTVDRSRKGISVSQSPRFTGIQDRVMIKGVSKSRWRCPECLRALVPNEDGQYHCRVHGLVNETGQMAFGVPGRDRPLDATMLSDEEQDSVIRIGR